MIKFWDISTCGSGVKKSKIINLRYKHHFTKGHEDFINESTTRINNANQDFFLEKPHSHKNVSIGYVCENAFSSWDFDPIRFLEIFTELIL